MLQAQQGKEDVRRLQGGRVWPRESDSRAGGGCLAAPGTGSSTEAAAPGPRLKGCVTGGGDRRRVQGKGQCNQRAAARGAGEGVCTTEALQEQPGPSSKTLSPQDPFPSG